MLLYYFTNECIREFVSLFITEKTKQKTKKKILITPKQGTKKRIQVRYLNNKEQIMWT